MVKLNRIYTRTGDDCSTGEGDFAGLITRFTAPSREHL